MRPRPVGGYEPDDAEQLELVQMWHLSRTALAGKKTHDGYSVDTPMLRRQWVIDTFLKEHPGTPRKWVAVWVTDNLGHFTRP